MIPPDTLVPLEATGTGSTIVCEELAAGALDFGHQLTGRPCSREVVISNMGRRGVSLSWGNTRVDELAKAFAKAAKGSGAHRAPGSKRACASHAGASLLAGLCSELLQGKHVPPLLPTRRQIV